MGSAPSSNQNQQTQINLIQLQPQQLLLLQNNNNNTKHPTNTNNKSNKNINIQQFTTSVQQMKFSKRNDLFQQKSKQTIISLNNALTNLKNNHLLSTQQFKKLHNTQHLVGVKSNKNNNILTKNNGQRKERYQYRKGVQKRQQLGVRQKRTQSSINVSSIASTYINDNHIINSHNNQLNNNDNNELEFIRQRRHNTIQSQAIASLLMKKRQKQHSLSQNAYRVSQNNQHMPYKTQQQQNSTNNNPKYNYKPNKHQQHNNKQTIFKSINNNTRKKKSKYVKSEKFIINKLENNDLHNNNKQWDQSLLVSYQLQQR